MGSNATDDDLRATQQAITETFGAWNENNASDLAFLGLSKNRNNLLMWSHYCDSHRGFVLGFDSAEPFFALPAHGKGVLRSVVYSSSRPVLPAPDGRRLNDFQRQSVNVFTKSEHWRYENELRMCASPGAADATEPGPSAHSIHLFRYPIESLVEVILGHRMVVKRREAIAKIVRDKYNNAKIYHTVLNESEYDLDILPFGGLVTQKRLDRACF